MIAAPPTWLDSLAATLAGSAGLPPGASVSAHVHLSSWSIERQVQQLPCFFPPPGLCAPADDLYLPVAQAVPFDLLLRRHRAIPSQQEFVAAYWALNAAAMARLAPPLRHALACRVARAWASFVADTHFA